MKIHFLFTFFTSGVKIILCMMFGWEANKKGYLGMIWQSSQGSRFCFWLFRDGKIDVIVFCAGNRTVIDVKCKGQGAEIFGLVYEL